MESLPVITAHLLRKKTKHELKKPIV